MPATVYLLVLSFDTVVNSKVSAPVAKSWIYLSSKKGDWGESPLLLKTSTIVFDLI